MCQHHCNKVKNHDKIKDTLFGIGLAGFIIALGTFTSHQDSKFSVCWLAVGVASWLIGSLIK